MRVFSILGTWLLVAHWFACAWFALGWMSRCQWGWYSETWLTVYYPELFGDNGESLCAIVNSGDDAMSAIVPLQTRYIHIGC